MCDINRRQYLGVVAAGVGVSLTGCLGSKESDPVEFLEVSREELNIEPVLGGVFEDDGETESVLQVYAELNKQVVVYAIQPDSQAVRDPPDSSIAPNGWHTIGSSEINVVDGGVRVGGYIQPTLHDANYLFRGFELTDTLGRDAIGFRTGDRIRFGWYDTEESEFHTIDEITY